MLSSNPFLELQDATCQLSITLSLRYYFSTSTKLERIVAFLDQATNQTKSEGVFRQACGDRTWSEVIPKERSLRVSIHIFYPFSYIIKLCFEARG